MQSTHDPPTRTDTLPLRVVVRRQFTNSQKQTLARFAYSLHAKAFIRQLGESEGQRYEIGISEPPINTLLKVQVLRHMRDGSYVPIARFAAKLNAEIYIEAMKTYDEHAATNYRIQLDANEE